MLNWRNEKCIKYPAWSHRPLFLPLKCTKWKRILLIHFQCAVHSIIFTLFFLSPVSTTTGSRSFSIFFALCFHETSIDRCLSEEENGTLSVSCVKENKIRNVVATMLHYLYTYTAAVGWCFNDVFVFCKNSFTFTRRPRVLQKNILRKIERKEIQILLARRKDADVIWETRTRRMYKNIPEINNLLRCYQGKNLMPQGKNLMPQMYREKGKVMSEIFYNVKNHVKNMKNTWKIHKNT